jgi:hypothetical protein
MVLLSLAASAVTSAHAGLVFSDRFDVFSLAGWKLVGTKIVERVNAPLREGNYAVELTLFQGRGYRSELALKQPKFAVGEEYWIGFSNYIPNAWRFDNNIGNADTVFNLHDRTAEGEPSRAGLLALKVVGNRWFIVSRSDPRILSTKNSVSSRQFEAGDVTRGRWNDWVIHIKLAFNRDGVLQVWKDGKRIVDFRGPNCFNDELNSFLKIGIYKPAWKRGEVTDVDRRTINIDEVRVAIGADGSYEAVDPSAVR